MPTQATYSVPAGLAKRPKRSVAPRGRKGGGKGGGQDFRSPVEQPNTAQSSTVAHVLDIIGVGPSPGLYAGLKSWYYDDTPVQAADGSYNFDQVSISVRPGTTDQSVMPGFFRTENEVTVAVEVLEDAPATQHVSNSDVDLVRVKVRLPVGLSQVITDSSASNYGDIVPATIQFRVQVSTDGGAYFDIAGSPFTVNEKTGPDYELQYEFELPDGAEWDIRVVRLTEDSALESLRNRTIFGSLTEITTGRVQYSDTIVVGQIANAEQFGTRIPSRSGDFIGVEVPIPSNYDPVEHTYDPEIWDGTFVTASTENPVWHIYNILTNTVYGCGQDVDQLLLDKFQMYDMAVYCDGRVPSSAGRRPQFIQGVDLPPTYNLTVSMGNHGFEEGDWIYIRGSLYPEADGLYQIDFASQNFFTIEDAISLPIFDNNPNLRVYSTEPRFTMNALFNVQQSAYAFISSMASCFRAMPYWTSGGVAFSIDSPVDLDSTRIVTRANTLNGEFNYAGAPLRNRASVCKVTWIDPDDSWKPAVEYVEDADMVERFGAANQIEVYAVGATTRSQARRHGLWILLTQRYCSQVLTYTAGLDNAHFRPGEVIRVSDPAIAGIRNGGKVAGFDSATGAAQVELDSPVDLAEGHSYTIGVWMSDGTVETRSVTNEAGDGQTLITVDPPFSATEMLVGAGWGMSGTDVALQTFRVVRVAEVRPDQFEVTAVQYEPTLYDAVDFGAAVAPRNFSDVPTGDLKPPQGLSAREYQYSDGLTVQPRALFSWPRADDARVTTYEFQVMRPDSLSWEPFDRVGGGGSGITSQLTAVLQQATEGTYLGRVRSRDNLGHKSPWYPSSEGAEFVFSGLLAPPPDVENFRTSISIQRIKLLWDPVQSLLLDHYEMRFSPLLVGATWAGALPVGTPLGKDQLQYDDVVVTGTYFIKAISIRGVESRNATAVIVDVIGNINLNQILVVEEHPDFAGVKDGVEVVGDHLELAGDEGALMSSWASLAEVVTLATGVGAFNMSGTYYGANYVDLGSVFDVRVTPEIHGDGYNIYNVMASWTSLAEVSNLAGFVEGEVGTEFLVDITSDDPADPDAVWEGYKPLIGADVRARGIRWRLDFWTTKPFVTARVDFFAVSIDMYDRIIDGKDQATTAGVLEVTFVPPFRSTRPSAVVTIQNAQQGDYFVVRNSDDTADGPDAVGMKIKVYDAAGDPVDRTIDYHVKGYGAVIT